MNKRSPIKAMIQLNLAQVDGAPEVLRAFGLTEEGQSELADKMRAILPADHPWFAAAGVTPPKNTTNSGNFLDVQRANHHILSPGLRNWRDDVTEEEMAEASNAQLGYDDSPKTARQRRAKAESMRRDINKWAFHATFDNYHLVSDHDWRWQARLND